MAHRAERHSALSQSLQAGARSCPGRERIRHARARGDTPETVRASVISQLQELPRGCVLEIELDFDPAGFLDDLAESGAYAGRPRLARGRWLLTLQPAGDRALIDLSEFEAPLPMERVLEAAAGLKRGEMLIARTPCFPRPLFAQLDQRGLDWEAVESDDESALVWVGRLS